MAQTLLGEKLQRSGFIPREVRFSMAVAEFLNNGGTTERAHQLIPIVAADKMGSGGLAIFADKANNEMPPASQPNGDDGLIPRVEKAGLGLPSSPPNDSAAGHTSTADGQISSARPLSPHQARARSQPRVDHGHFAAREPSAADRAAMISVAKESAVAVLTVFDRYKVRDGRPLKTSIPRTDEARPGGRNRISRLPLHGGGG